jgi:phosphatidyl-myo-inositol dimannoside synthase
MSAGALLLTPSRGQGGGIERYVEALEWSFAEQGIDYGRIDLRRAGPAAHAQLFAETRDRLRAMAAPTRLVLGHRALLPVASMLARDRTVSGISVICHGSDVWGSHARPRWLVEDRLMRRHDVRAIAASSFTAGALSRGVRAAVLPPGLSRRWFDTLVKASATARHKRYGFELVTAFRLTDWQIKGLPELLDAIAGLGRSDIHLTVCGTGEPPASLRRLVEAHSCCTLRPGLSDQELAGQLAASDLFVLATRTRPGRNASGEGFGLVLLEAQVAGTPVVGPAYGGSRDAYIDQVTGVAPTDESERALARTLAGLLQCPGRLPQMGKRAGEWASESFAPERYAPLAVARLL